MGLFKSIGKFAKKAVKVIRKAAPIVATLAGGPLGGVIAKGATKLMTVGTAASRLKSAGVNSAKAAILKQAPPSTVAVVNRVAKAAKVSTASRKKSAPKKQAAKPAARKAAPKPPSQATLKRLFTQWQASDQSEDWESYARARL